MSSIECTTPALLFAAVLLLVACDGAAVAEESAEESNGLTQLQRFKLPAALREVSGLAVAGPNRLLAVADEQALVFTIDLDAEQVEPALALGQPAQAGDFEGIEVSGDRVVLTDSDGRLLWVEKDTVGEWATGLGEDWEIEGLARHPQSDLYFLAAKGGRGERRDQLPMLLALDLEARVVRAADHIRPDYRAAQQHLGLDQLSPSGVAFAADGQSFWVVAARQKALMQFSADGALIEAFALNSFDKHRQAEGLVLLEGGRIVIADEGKKRGRLTVYRHDR